MLAHHFIIGILGVFAEGSAAAASQAHACTSSKSSTLGSSLIQKFSSNLKAAAGYNYNVPTAAPSITLITLWASPQHPPWICFLQKTVEANEGLRFFYVTNLPAPDCGSQPLHHSMGKFVVYPLTMHDLAARAVRALEFNESEAQTLAANMFAHKNTVMCDLKPAYGILYSDLLAGSLFYGYSDIDLIFGSLSAVNFQDMVHDVRPDIITLYSNDRPFFAWGPLMLFRNNNMTKNLFKRYPDWKNVFLNTIYDGFDEYQDKFTSVILNAPDLKLAVLPDLLRPGQPYATTEEWFGVDRPENAIYLGPSNRAVWNHGRLSLANEAGEETTVLSFHFQGWKRNLNESPSLLRLNGTTENCFVMNSQGFADCDEASYRLR